MQSFFTSTIAALALSLGIVAPAVAEELKSLQGNFLIAEDRMRDPNFSHSVVLIVTHDRSGAMGLIINRQMGRGPLKKLLEPLGIDEEGLDEKKAQAVTPLHFGGPVEFGRAFVLHSGDWEEKGTIQVVEGVSLSSKASVLKSIAKGKGPSRYLLLLGYAGWAPGQLEAEIKRGGWETAPADAEITLDDDVKTKWQRAIAKVSIPL